MARRGCPVQVSAPVPTNHGITTSGYRPPRDFDFYLFFNRIKKYSKLRPRVSGCGNPKRYETTFLFLKKSGICPDR